ncbi:DMT family transporter [Photobacterium leiognathi]|uniref:DMT family transporter n=1 Tax=Photobacterium leiognathi TaxID=553611 RepID=UPI00273913FC|nr:DMT family transporter [Photobacterium leiognathi]
MQNINKYSLLALLAGGLLALMIYLNSQLAHVTSALSASWIAHGIGAIFALGLFSLLKSNQDSPGLTRLSKLYWLGGIPGSFTVILSSMTVNSKLGLSGTLALALVGQFGFSMVSEHFGFFKLRKREFTFIDITPIALVITGSLVLIFNRG